MDFNTLKFETRFTELETIIKDKTKTLAERQAAFQELLSLKADYQIDVKDTGKGAETTLLHALKSEHGGDWTIDDVDKYLSICNNDFSTRSEAASFNAYKAKLAELEKNQYTYTETYSSAGAVVISTENKEITKQIDLLKAENVELEKMRKLNDDTDASRKQMLEDYKYAYAIKKKAADYDKRSRSEERRVGQEC